MTYWLSHPIESLAGADDDRIVEVDTLIVGSGYGAAMAALALSESDESRSLAGRIVVFERGEEYLPQDFPRTVGELPGYTPDNIRGNVTNALWDVRAGDGAVSITGNGLGGTSLVNASVAVPPEQDTLEQWPSVEADADWHTLFSKCYPKIYQLLGVSEIDNPDRFAKYKALKNTVYQLDSSADIKAAPVAINFDGGGIHSVDHKPCNHCGNCVIGCHSGAKQSLNMNAWPLAVQLGVELYTGARVMRLSRCQSQWKVYFKSARVPDTERELIANRVILSAGSIGSTEILNRSTQLTEIAGRVVPALCLSDRLGKNFSANGDGLIFSSGEKNKVNAVADVPDDTADPECGPTIIGIARTKSSSIAEGQITIEDGAIPYPLAEIWRETITMQSYIKRFVTDKRSEWHDCNSSHDYLATSNDFVKHGQVLLTMGFDGSNGRLVADKETGNLLPSWPKSKEGNDYYTELHNFFDTEDSKIYSGGEYHANPLYKLLPEQFSQVFEGAGDVPSSVVTVHPLGGCGMGSSARNGVINHNGQVYCCDDPLDETAVYEDLYVLDGASLPGAVGVNPMIAISALSYTLASRIAGRAEPLATPFEKLHPNFRELPEKQIEPVNREKTVSAKFSERLLLELSKLPLNKQSRLKKLFQNRLPDNAKTIVLDVTFYFDDAKHQGRDFNNSLDKWLCNPVTPLRAKATLMASDREVLHGSADTFVPMPPLMEFDGTVTLGSRDRESSYSRLFRTAAAVSRFAFYRTYAFLSAFSGTADRESPSKGIAQAGNQADDQVSNQASAHEKLCGFFRVAKLHADWRYLEYELVQSDDDSTGLKISGRKKLAYTLSAPSLWQSLLFLPVRFSHENTQLKARLAVDLLRITRGPSPLQITESTDEPANVVAVAGFGLLLTRLIGTTHFWSFGANNYSKFASSKEIDKERLRRPPTVMEFNRDGQRVQSLPAQILKSRDKDYQFDDDGKRIEDELLSRLVRYREDEADRPAVLLVHGLSHSSEIYWPEHISETYVQFLLSCGYDVWVFDHRTSANTRKKININHTWDDIATEDVPWAVGKVFSEINRDADSGRESGRESGDPKLVNIYSHCIGAGAVAMAVLNGNLQQPNDCNKTMVGSLIPHAVTPWVFSSCENRTRANLWGFVKDFEYLDKIDPRMHNDPTFAHILLDRVASSTIDLKARMQWPWFLNLLKRRSSENEYAMAMYFRYTVFWGKQWVDKNVPDKLKKRFPSMVGEVPATILQQTYFSVRRKRLVSKDARNIYVTEQNFKKFWTFPTLFLHGEENQVFDVESSRLSAFRLAELRQKHSSHSGSDSIPDYAKHGVWLRTQADFGHMDMIIGDQATKKIGPIIDKFFKASEAQNREWNHLSAENRTYTVFETSYGDETLSSEDLPVTRTKAGKFPFTGPVVSYANKKSLRIWAEADDYATEPSTGLSVSADNCRDVDSLPLPAGSSAEHGSFHGIEIGDPGNITTRMQVRVQHADDINRQSHMQTDALCNHLATSSESFSSSQDLARQRDIDHDQGAFVDLHRMPWFRRLYAESDSLDKNRQSFENISFVAGSCLHPGLTFSRDYSDSIFQSVWQQAVAEDGIDFLLLLGDQIYADATAGLFDPKASYERYRMRYREAYGARSFRQVLSHVPTYFVVDDHAYRDDFSGVNHSSESSELEIAKSEAMNFQAYSNNTSQLWSDFEVCGHPFFCFDTRFERSGISRADLEAIIKPGQAAAFERWIESNKHKKALFLCTGSPLFPIRSDWIDYPELSRYSDTLVAYPGFLKYLVDKLTGLDCRLYMLSGDPHLSCRGSGTLSYDAGTDGVKAIIVENVVCSPLNAPFPFANARASDYSWGEEQELTLPDSRMSLRFQQNMLSTAAKQFCQMDYNAGTGELQVKVHPSEAISSVPEVISFS